MITLHDLQLLAKQLDNMQARFDSMSLNVGQCVKHKVLSSARIAYLQRDTVLLEQDITTVRMMAARLLGAMPADGRLA